VILEAYPEHWLVLSTLMVYTWRIAERYRQRFGAWKLVKANFAVLPTNREPPDPPLKPTSGERREKKKRRPKQHKCAHKQGQGVKKPLKPVHGRKRKVKRNLTKMAAAVLSPALLFQIAAAKVPTFDFHSEITRMQSGCKGSHGLISINDICLDSQDMKRLKAVMEDIPQGLLGQGGDSINFIVDSGASMTSTFDVKDFVEGSLKLFDRPPVLTGISGTVEIKGQGEIKVQVVMDSRAVKEIATQAYWIPDMKCRLFSPQSFFQDGERGSDRGYQFMVGRDSSCFKFGEGLENQLTLQMDPQTKLHQFKAYKSMLTATNAHILKACVEDDDNKNLSRSQKLWFKLHCKLGHHSFKQVQYLARRGWLGSKEQAMLSKTVELPHCAACIMGKQVRDPSGATRLTTVNSGALSKGVLVPGQVIYSDQFSARVKGKSLPAHSGVLHNSEYSGGTVFYDAASKFLCVELQVGYTATETIKSKLRFERQAMDVGVKVSSYHTDNGIYRSEEFLKELQAKGQGVKMSGVSAQFQNGAAESIIKGVVQTARTMMLHANLRWPEVADESLWPHALQYQCTYITLCLQKSLGSVLWKFGAGARAVIMT